MNKINEFTVDKQCIENPKFPEFGDNIPARTQFLRVAENITKETVLSSGDKIARFMTVHWDNTEKKVEFSFDSAAGEFTFIIPKNIGDFFSISWALNDSILSEYDDKNIISFGFDHFDFGKKKYEQMKLFGNLTLIKGKKNEKLTCAADYFEKRIQASFSMDEQKEYWKTAVRGWMDFVIAEPSSGKIRLTQPMIWIQSKIIL